MGLYKYGLIARSSQQAEQEEIPIRGRGFHSSEDEYFPHPPYKLSYHQLTQLHVCSISYTLGPCVYVKKSMF